jgi:hypothetical protein
VRLTLAGLDIARVDGDAPVPGPAELLWRVHRVESLPPPPGVRGPVAVIRAIHGAGGMRTEHLLGERGEVHCRFLVDAAGREVTCWVRREVSDRDLLSLFGEAILRTILVRRGLVSFHAAALARDGTAILIMAGKGCGKSTLSSALQQRGWDLLADDLTRIDHQDGRWHAFPGLRQTKLLADSAAALGFQPETLPRRWDGGSDEADPNNDKRLLDPLREQPPARAPLVAMFVLGKRRVGAVPLSHKRAAPIAAVRALVEHSTRDPLDVRYPPPAMLAAAGSLVRDVPIVELALANSLDALPEAAEAVASLASGLARREAA